MRRTAEKMVTALMTVGRRSSTDWYKKKEMQNLNFSGIPHELVDEAARRVQEAPGTTLEEFYWAALRYMMFRISTGDRQEPPAQYKGGRGKRMSFWVRGEFKRDLDDFLLKWWPSNRSSFLIAALRCYLSEISRIGMWDDQRIRRDWKETRT